MVKWPWVSRELATLAQSHARDAEDRAFRADQRYEALLARYHALKMAGASESGAVVERMEPKPPDPCVVAALAKAGNNYRLQQHLLGVIREMRATQQSDAVIIAAIYEGIPDDPATVGTGD